MELDEAGELAAKSMARLCIVETILARAVGDWLEGDW